jgi:hypothetical protein
MVTADQIQALPQRYANSDVTRHNAITMPLASSIHASHADTMRAERAAA